MTNAFKQYVMDVKSLDFPSDKEQYYPDETRPFTVREYARIQTFPDKWKFAGSVLQQYKQIGNTVPCNLGQEIGFSIVTFLNSYYKNTAK